MMDGESFLSRVSGLIGTLRAYCWWGRLWLYVYRARVRRGIRILVYGRNEVARMDAVVDQLMQPRRDAFFAMLREIDEKYEQAVREGRARPMERRLSEYEWPT